MKEEKRLMEVVEFEKTIAELSHDNLDDVTKRFNDIQEEQAGEFYYAAKQLGWNNGRTWKEYLAYHGLGETSIREKINLYLFKNDLSDIADIRGLAEIELNPRITASLLGTVNGSNTEEKLESIEEVENFIGKDNVTRLVLSAHNKIKKAGLEYTQENIDLVSAPSKPKETKHKEAIDVVPVSEVDELKEVIRLLREEVASLKSAETFGRKISGVMKTFLGKLRSAEFHAKSGAISEAVMNETYSKYCKVLGVKEDASTEEIKSAYKKKAKKFHPDVKGTGDEELFQEILEAYNILKRK